jgi:hypothetical protein
MQSPTMRTSNDALEVQLSVHVLRRRHRPTQPGNPRIAICGVIGAAALGTRAVPRCERHRLVVEEQVCVAARLPLLPPPPAEFEQAGDPQITRVESHDLPLAMQDAAIARPCTAQLSRDDLASRRHSIAGCHPAGVPPQPDSAPPG